MNVKEVTSIEGDVTLGNRKGKVYNLYDLTITLAWEGRLADEPTSRSNGDGPEAAAHVRCPSRGTLSPGRAGSEAVVASGNLKITNVTQDETVDEYDVRSIRDWRLGPGPWTWGRGRGHGVGPWTWARGLGHGLGTGLRRGAGHPTPAVLSGVLPCPAPIFGPSPPRTTTPHFPLRTNAV